MTTITPEQRRAIEQAGDAPVRLNDPETNASYVLITAATFERVRRLLAPDEAAEPSDAYPLLDRVAAAEGWDDPALDIYNDDGPTP